MLEREINRASASLRSFSQEWAAAKAKENHRKTEESPPLRFSQSSSISLFLSFSLSLPLRLQREALLVALGPGPETL